MLILECSQGCYGRTDGRTHGRTDGRTDGSVTISPRNFVGEGIIKDEVLLTVSCPIFPSILIAKNLLTGSLKNRSIDNLETQKKSISMKNSQFFDYLLYAKPK
jgi:hypothetical protein